MPASAVLSGAVPEEMHPLLDAQALQANLTTIAREIDAVVDGHKDKRSLFSRAAAWWSSLRLWKKLLIGAVIALPTLALGIYIQLPWLIVLGAFSVLSFLGIGFLLSNHEHQDRVNKAELKARIDPLVSVLRSSIDILATLGRTFTLLAQKFGIEVDRLELGVDRLHDENSEFKQQNDRLRAVSDELSQKAIYLTQLAKRIEDMRALQALELAENRDSIQRLLAEAGDMKQEFTGKLAALEATNASLTQNAANHAALLEQQSRWLADALALFSSQKASDAEESEKRALFLKKVDAHMQQYGATFSAIAGQFKGLVDELARVKEEYRATLRDLERSVAANQANAAKVDDLLNNRAAPPAGAKPASPGTARASTFASTRRPPALELPNDTSAIIKTTGAIG